MVSVGRTNPVCQGALDVLHPTSGTVLEGVLEGFISQWPGLTANPMVAEQHRAELLSRADR